jgi:hypothetical protein
VVFVLETLRAADDRQYSALGIAATYPLDALDRARALALRVRAAEWGRISQIVISTVPQRVYRAALDAALAALLNDLAGGEAFSREDADRLCEPFGKVFGQPLLW